tara:strand:- start:118 stop:525 length:408 start_codon:yes stop_codon:yes gene_type:complete
MNQTNYDTQCRAKANSAIASLSHDKLADRQAARADYTELLRDTEHLTNLVDMLITGDYGYEYYLICQDIINGSKRRNKVAALSIVIAAVETSCPAVMAIGAWKALTSDEQTAANKIFATIIEQAPKTEWATSPNL